MKYFTDAVLYTEHTVTFPANSETGSYNLNRPIFITAGLGISKCTINNAR